ncbi:MAG TPA: oligopeptide/dipeptide ABC transporter ATP-binding protein [Candidatus Dormibacteraeota bacterium]|jgi:peptide/nickel transport system ATP-binding protein
MFPESPVLSGADLVRVFSGRGDLTGILGGASQTRAVDGVDIDLNKGEIVALVGESGSGKTTLGRLLTLLETLSSGRLVLDGKVITHARGRVLKEVRRKVQIIFQNPYDSLDPRDTVHRAVTEPLAIHSIGSRRDRTDRATEMLQAVGLTPVEQYLDKLPHELSGGQRQRVAIARAMVLRPEVLIADEPISMLDASIRSSVLNIMLDLRDQFGLSILFITHDLASARYVSDRVLVMYRGQIVESGPTDEVVNRPAHPYTKLLVEASSRRLARQPATRLSLATAACRFASRCPQAQDLCVTTAPPLFQVTGRHGSLCHFAGAVADSSVAGADFTSGS